MKKEPEKTIYKSEHTTLYRGPLGEAQVEQSARRERARIRDACFSTRLSSLYCRFISVPCSDFYLCICVFWGGKTHLAVFIQKCEIVENVSTEHDVLPRVDSHHHWHLCKS